VVVAQRAIEADLLVRPHRREHVRLPLVVDGFQEALRGAQDARHTPACRASVHVAFGNGGRYSASLNLNIVVRYQSAIGSGWHQAQ
jgi:hypothetical protein